MIQTDFLAQCAQRPEPFVRITMTNGESAPLSSYLMSVNSFFAFGTLPSTEQSGFEFQSFQFQQEPAHWSLEAPKAARRASQTETSKLKSKLVARAAQQLYLTTLNQNFFETHFAMMGPYPTLRKALRLFQFFNPVQRAIQKQLLRFRISRELTLSLKGAHL